MYSNYFPNVSDPGKNVLELLKTRAKVLCFETYGNVAGFAI